MNNVIYLKDDVCVYNIPSTPRITIENNFSELNIKFVTITSENNQIINTKQLA